MTEYFYNFTINGLNQGYSYLYLDHKKLYSVTRFAFEGSIKTNKFLLKLRDECLLACKHGEAKWVDLQQVASDHYPDCAYPLLLPKAIRQPYHFTVISADDGSILGESSLVRENDTITETVNERPTRKFTMDGCTPVQIDWGGAISTLCASAVESVAGSTIDFQFDELGRELDF